jgi:hypothetical protein
MLPAMGRAGNPPLSWSMQVGSLILIVAVGYIPIAAGTGCPIIHGGGPRFITAVGSGMDAWAGVGFQAGFGDLPGLAGDMTTLFVAGHRYLQAPALRRA